jgi:hypothetical protein
MSTHDEKRAVLLEPSEAVFQCLVFTMYGFTKTFCIALFAASDARGSGTFCAVRRIGSDLTAPTFDLQMCLRQFEELREQVKVLVSHS